MYLKFLPYLCCLKACSGLVSGGMDPARIRGMQSNFPGENMTIGGQPRVVCVASGRGGGSEGC